MTVNGVVRSVEGNRQKDDFLLNCREQSLEASRGVQGLTGRGRMQGPWAGGFPPPGSVPFFLKQTGCSFLWWHHRGQPASP